MPKPHGGKLINRVLAGEEKDRVEGAKGLPQIVLTKELAKEVQNIAYGVFSPLEGFLTREDYISVLNERRLTTGIPWTIPIVLDISPDSEIKEGNDAALMDEDGPVAIMHIEDVFQYDKEEMAQKVFGTTDLGHPGVANVYRM
ncbi:unnamed protein product, partial [marine sediment metagenome]